MSIFYSSLDWVLSHWAHFTVGRFICVCVCVFLFHTAYLLCYCERGGMDLMGLKHNNQDPVFLQCFVTFGSTCFGNVTCKNSCPI